MKIKQRGFTLVEVLIVVVIIAILAALILPRLTSQTENAYIAEAQNMLGSMRRAQATACALGGLDCANNATANDYPNTFAKLGMQMPTMTNWIYLPNITGINSARRRAGGVYKDDIITLASNGTFVCNGGTGTTRYSAVGGSAVKGCRA